MNKYETDVRQAVRNDGARRDANSAYAFYNDFPVTYMPIKAGIFNIYLFGPIEDAMQFVSAIEVLNAAGENDVVFIHLSTNGGSLDATDTFIQAMRDCDARIIVKATGGVHSAGTVILLNADEFTLSENFNALIHNGSCGVGGKFSDFRAQAKYTQRYMERVMYNTYEGFLTDDEINDLINGKDFWLDCDDFAKRWEARNDYLRERMEAEQRDALESLKEEAEAVTAAPKRVRKKLPPPTE